MKIILFLTVFILSFNVHASDECYEINKINPEQAKKIIGLDTDTIKKRVCDDQKNCEDAKFLEEKIKEALSNLLIVPDKAVETCDNLIEI